MDVVSVVIHGLDEYMGIVIGDLLEFQFHMSHKAVVPDIPAIFGRKDEMIFAVVYGMRELAILHAFILILGDAGSTPSPDLTVGVLRRCNKQWPLRFTGAALLFVFSIY